MGKHYRTNLLICAVFYAIALAITAFYAVNNGITLDQESEFAVYWHEIQCGHWVDSGLVGAGLMSTYIPSLLQRLLDVDAVLLFKIFPCVFFALMPAFVFLIARERLSLGQSILSGLFVLVQYFFLGFSDMGRVAIAMGILSLLMWCVFEKRYVLGSVAGVLLVASHYATTYIATGMLMLLLAFSVWQRHFNKPLVVVLVALIISTGVWYGLVAKTPAEYAKVFIVSSVTGKSDTLEKPRLDHGYPYTVAVQQELEKEFAQSSKIHNFLRLESRESVVQAAFGKTLPVMNASQKVEFGMSWTILIMLTYGLFIAVKRKILPAEHLVLAITAYGLVALTAIMPHISVYYGIMRVYFTGLIVLAPCWVVGTKRLTIYGQGAFLVLYALCTADVI